MKDGVSYAAVKGSHLSDRGARVLGAVVERLTERDGSVTPASLLAEATDPSSPAHPFFTWDDTEAAKRWRLAEAGKILRSIRVVVEDKKEEVRAFHIVTNPVTETRGYVPIETVLKNDGYVSQILERAKAEQLAWARRYERFRHAAQLKNLFLAIDDLANAKAVHEPKPEPAPEPEPSDPEVEEAGDDEDPDGIEPEDVPEPAPSAIIVTAPSGHKRGASPYGGGRRPKIGWPKNEKPSTAHMADFLKNPALLPKRPPGM